MSGPAPRDPFAAPSARVGPGLPAPRAAAPSDLWHWEVLIEVPELATARAEVVSSGGDAGPMVDVRSLGLGYGRAALAHDRDGHALRLLER